MTRASWAIAVLVVLAVSAAGLAVSPEDLLGDWESSKASYEFTYENGQLGFSKLGSVDFTPCRVFGNTLTGTYSMDGVPHTENAEIVVDGSGRPIEIRWELGAVFVRVDATGATGSSGAEAAFVGTWEGQDADVYDDSLTTLVITTVGGGLAGTLSDTYSVETDGTIVSPGYAGAGTGTLTSATTAQMTFFLTRSDGDRVTLVADLTLSGSSLGFRCSRWNEYLISPPGLWANLQRVGGDASEPAGSPGADDDAAEAESLGTLGNASPEDLRWEYTGGPLGGLGYDIRFDFDDPDIWYVTDAFSGAHKSTNGGLTWFPVNNGIDARTGDSGDVIPIFSITVDPHNPHVIWAGTQGVLGIYKSADSGLNWEKKVRGIVEPDTGISFRGFTVDPHDSSIVYAAGEIPSWVWAGETRTGEFDLTKGVVYRTENGGQSWDAIWRGNNLARYVWVDPRDSDVIYVSTGIFDREAANSDVQTNEAGGVGIAKSTDGGRTWRELNHTNGLRNLYIGSLFMHPEDPDTLLAGAGSNVYRSGSGVYLSTDGGETWQWTLGGGDGHDYVITSVEFAASDPSIAYAGGASAVYRSEDGGRTWRCMSGGPPTWYWGPPGIVAGVPIDFQVDPSNPDRIFSNNYQGGNFLSEDGGRTWVDASKGYTGAMVRDIAIDPRAPETVYVVGRSGPFRSFDGGDNWQGLAFPPAIFAEWGYGSVTLNPEHPEIVIVSDEHQGNILLSTDGGLDFEVVHHHEQADPDLADGYRAGFFDIAFAFSNPDVVYAGMTSRLMGDHSVGLGGVFKSTDGGRTWQRPTDEATKDMDVWVLAVDPTDHRTVYAGGFFDGVLKTTNAGATWSLVGTGILRKTVDALAVDPRNPGVVYAGTWGAGVYKTSDGGATWWHSSVGLNPEAVIADLVIDPTNSAVLYAADQLSGVFRSVDGGRRWERITNGLRMRRVNALAVSRDGNTLYATTEGGGVYRLEAGSGSTGEDSASPRFGDRDGDGVPDDEDFCPDIHGDPQMSGC
jgi:photosystem II stability/assembly factor-like uncharacterized protein